MDSIRCSFRQNTNFIRFYRIVGKGSTKISGQLGGLYIFLNNTDKQTLKGEERIQVVIYVQYINWLFRYSLSTIVQHTFHENRIS